MVIFHGYVSHNQIFCHKQIEAVSSLPSSIAQTSIEAAFYFWFLGGQELLIIADEDLKSASQP